MGKIESRIHLDERAAIEFDITRIKWSAGGSSLGPKPILSLRGGRFLVYVNRRVDTSEAEERALLIQKII